jgi:hypothetical protein
MVGHGANPWIKLSPTNRPKPFMNITNMAEYSLSKELYILFLGYRPRAFQRNAKNALCKCCATVG